MFKIVQMMRFTPGLNRSEAYERWFGPHAALGRQVPGVRRYVQNAASAALHLVGIDPDRPTTFDGYSCVWFDGRAGFEAATRSAEWAAVVADGGTLFDATFEGAALTAVEERLIVDGPVGPIKTVWFCRFPVAVRSDRVLIQASSNYWTETHGRGFGARVPGIGRYLQNHVIEPEPARRPPFDGFSECWFDDLATYEAMNVTPEWHAMNEDAVTLFDRDLIVAGWSAALDEHVVVG